MATYEFSVRRIASACDAFDFESPSETRTRHRFHSIHPSINISIRFVIATQIKLNENELEECLWTSAVAHSFFLSLSTATKTDDALSIESNFEAKHLKLRLLLLFTPNGTSSAFEICCRWTRDSFYTIFLFPAAWMEKISFDFPWKWKKQKQPWSASRRRTHLTALCCRNVFAIRF